MNFPRHYTLSLGGPAQVSGETSAESMMAHPGKRFVVTGIEE